MDGAWSRLKSVYPYTPSRYYDVRGDNDVEKLKQPLISHEDEDDHDDHDDPLLLDEEAGLLSHHQHQHHQHPSHQHGDDYTCYSKRATYEYVPPQKRQRDSSHHGAFFASVEPKFMRSIGRLTALAASAFGSPFAPPTTASSGREKTSPSDPAAATTNSAHMMTSIRSVVRTRRKTESAEDATERALARLAMLTVICTLLLVLGVAAHA